MAVKISFKNVLFCLPLSSTSIYFLLVYLLLYHLKCFANLIIYLLEMRNVRISIFDMHVDLSNFEFSKFPSQVGCL